MCQSVRVSVCFISKRYMGDNVRLIYDLINYLNTKNKPGLLLCLDFEKAFDSLDWQFMFRALRAFGFGNVLCRWIDTFYKNIKSTVTVNGQTTQWFTVECETNVIYKIGRQGDQTGFISKRYMGDRAIQYHRTYLFCVLKF